MDYSYFDSYYNQNIEYWEHEAIITFADESKYSLDEYFDDDVTFGNLIDSYEELEKWYENSIWYRIL